MPGKYWIQPLLIKCINSIEIGCFQNFVSLEQLNINLTCIKNLEINSFQHLCKLEILNLERNQIEQIEACVLNLKMSQALM